MCWIYNIVQKLSNVCHTPFGDDDLAKEMASAIKIFIDKNMELVSSLIIECLFHFIDDICRFGCVNYYFLNVYTQPHVLKTQPWLFNSFIGLEQLDVLKPLTVSPLQNYLTLYFSLPIGRRLLLLSRCWKLWKKVIEFLSSFKWSRWYMLKRLVLMVSRSFVRVDS